MQIFFILGFSCTCYAFFFYGLSLFYCSPLRFSCTPTSLSALLHIFFSHLQPPHFLMHSDIVVNRFIVDEGRSLSRNFNSITSYVREMIYAMHSCSHVHARRHEKERTMFRLGFILALSTFITLTGSFLFFFIFLSPLRVQDLLTGN